MHNFFQNGSWLAVVSIGASLVMGCSDHKLDGAGKAQQDILHGDVIHNDDARDGPWVTITGTRPQGLIQKGSGILLSNDVVLTAGHVVSNVKTAALTIHARNPPNTRRTTASMVVTHRSHHEYLEMLNGRNDHVDTAEYWNGLTDDERRARVKDPGWTDWRLGIDLALIRLKDPLPQPNWAEVDCLDDPNNLPNQFDVVSGVLQPNQLLKNSATFQALAKPDNVSTLSLTPFGGEVFKIHLIPNINVGPNGTTSVSQRLIGGDSGSAFLDPVPSRPGPNEPRDAPDARLIHGILSTFENDTQHMQGIWAGRYCEWIDTVKNKLHTNASFTERDDVRINPGNLKNYITSLTNDGVDVRIATSSDVTDYQLTLDTPPTELRAAEIGTFSDSGAGLVFLDDGKIVSRNVFDDTPLLIDASGEYSDLLVANTTSTDQPYNDLIAIHAFDSGASLFRGGASGLFRANVDGIAITRVDDDAWADVVVVDGRSVTVASPASVDTRTLPFPPVNSTSGRFTSNEPNTGYDLAFLGANSGEPNQVAWCRMDHPTALFRDSSCTTLSMPDGLEPISIRASFHDADEYEDLEVAFANGQVAIFAGSAADLTFQTFLQALPSARTDDGKLLLVSGTESDTLGVPMAEFYVSEPVDAAGDPTLEPLIIQLYDFGIGGSYDNLPEESGLTTCLNLYASPTPGVMGEILLKSVSDTEFGVVADLGWHILFDSEVEGHSAHAVSASDVHWYRVEMKLVNLTDTCDAAPVVDHAGFNGFKLRTSGQVRSPNALALYGSDVSGEFASFEPGPNTDYDGIFDVPFQVGGSVERPEIPEGTPLNISLRQADADDADLDSDADGQREDIFFQLFEGSPQDGTALLVQRTEGQQEDNFNIPTNRVEDPSGNSSGDGATAIFEKHTTEGISAQTVQSGLHTWHWENVGAENAIQLQPITGSPISHEYIAAGGRWVGSSAAQAPNRLLDLDDEQLESLLPVDVGDAGFGYLRSFGSVDAAREGLTLASKDLDSLLSRELLALKLNQKRSTLRAEPLAAGFVLSTRVSIGDLIEQVDAMLGGADVDLDPERALQLMAAANAGQVTYFSPRELVLSSADRDADGVPDSADNCVMEANADQLDSNGDGIGERCEPTPTVWCVERRESGGAVAVFGYDSPLRDFRIPAGPRNAISGQGVDTTPPVLFRRGGLQQAVSVSFDGESVTWQVLDKTATATLDAPRCSEIGPGSAVCEASASEFHCCTSIADCQVAGQFGLYATETIRLGARVSVLDSDWRPGSLLSLGSIVMDAEAEAGDVMGAGELVVGDRVGLFGDIALGGDLTELGRSTSFRVRYAPLDAPDLSAFARPFQGEMTAPLSLQDGGVLEPGQYGPTEIVEGETILVAGEYHFTNLEVAEDATLSIDGASGPVIVHIAGSVTLLGEVDALAGDLLIELHGSGAVLVSTDLAATIIAPDGRIVVEQPGSVQTGAYFARSIEIASDVTLLQREPLAPRR